MSTTVWHLWMEESHFQKEATAKVVAEECEYTAGRQHEVKLT